jgi:hypothetical protein
MFPAACLESRLPSGLGRAGRGHAAGALSHDNIVYARPQTGLRSADIIYVIPVESTAT